MPLRSVKRQSTLFVFTPLLAGKSSLTGKEASCLHGWAKLRNRFLPPPEFCLPS